MVGLGKVAKDLTPTDVPMATKEKVSSDKRPHVKRKTKKIEIHPNMKKESCDKRVKDLHIDTNTGLTGRKGHRAS